MGKKKLRSDNVEDKEDRLSSLPDELIHRILLFVDISEAVRTSILSNRWKAIWTTLPSLKFTTYRRNLRYFIDKFLTHRNHQSEVFELDLPYALSLPSSLVTKLVSYAILHNVQHLKLDFWTHFHLFESGVDAVKLSTLDSTSLKKLTLRNCDFCKLLESECWNLPALTTLHLIQVNGNDCKFPESYLKCLTSLQSLLLDGFELPTSISLPTLTNLHLNYCKLPQNVWEFPALLTLKLEYVDFPENMSDFLSALINLQNLTLFIERDLMGDLIIDCPQLVNLKISTKIDSISNTRKIMVFAPKIRNFSSVGFFSITFGVCQLENVDIKLQESEYFQYKKSNRPLKKLKTYYHRVTQMLGSARILTLDSDTIEALSYVSDFLIKSPYAFYNLKYVKVPPGFEISSISTNLRCYLLGRSPKATIVTKLPQDELIPQVLPVCQPAPYMLPQNSLSTPVAQSGSSSTQVSLTQSDLGLWQGHEVKLEFLGILDSIVKKYPETFDHFTINSKKLCTMKLNTLCTTVEAFTKTLMTDMDAEIIAEYRALFADMQRSFNVQWLVNRLNNIEQLKLSEAKLQAVDSSIDDARNKVDDARSKFIDAKSKLDDAKTELQDLQALRMSMITKVHEDFGTMGATSISAGYVGDNLFSGS